MFHTHGPGNHPAGCQLIIWYEHIHLILIKTMTLQGHIGDDVKTMKNIIPMFFINILYKLIFRYLMGINQTGHIDSIEVVWQYKRPDRDQSPCG